MNRFLAWLLGRDAHEGGDLLAMRLSTRACPVSRVERTALVRRQLAEVRKMRRERTRIDMPGSAERRVRGELKAERGLEDLPRRDGTIVEPLRHHRHPWHRGRPDRFEPRPKEA